MTFGFRKGFKSGPFRMTLSKYRLFVIPRRNAILDRSGREAQTHLESP